MPRLPGGQRLASNIFVNETRALARSFLPSSCVSVFGRCWLCVYIFIFGRVGECSSSQGAIIYKRKQKINHEWANAFTRPNAGRRRIAVQIVFGTMAQVRSVWQWRGSVAVEFIRPVRKHLTLVVGPPLHCSRGNRVGYPGIVR